MFRHEIVGEVIKVGRNVEKFKVGDIAGVGPTFDSCRSCSDCNEGFEIYCPKMILTYNAIDKDGSVTYGGYSDKTGWSAFGCGRVRRTRSRAVKFARAMNMKVTVISTSPGKKKEALESHGADAFIVSTDQQQMQEAELAKEKMQGKLACK
ncbi:hypothetical protein K1719_017550 [Acacia pycnantha]|nr:hypothetical protein K1719_017550 [Acacia pycnantha]